MELINENLIGGILRKTKRVEKGLLDEILFKASEGKGLDLTDVAALLTVREPEQRESIYKIAWQVKQEIYGSRMVFFAPLYLSNYCVNSCEYCGFSIKNLELIPKTLSRDEAVEEAMVLAEKGQKRLLLVSSENQQVTPDYIAGIMEGIYKKTGIKRLNVNMAPLSVEGFKTLKEAGIGTYQVFQETYHRTTYELLHQKGPKKDYQWRITSHERAFRAGIEDLGFGVLFGLYDYRFEVLALLQHIRIFEEIFGVGPHTISVPRWRPAPGIRMQEAPCSLDDDTFATIIAVLRLAVPYTGIILSTRERPELRDKLFNLGVSQISAGSSTSPGGYKEKGAGQGQFLIDDSRTMEEIVTELCHNGFMPSFCTACYRRERTGPDFMALAKKGAIKNMCQANAIITFKEYLLDFALPETQRLGEGFLVGEINRIPDGFLKKEVMERLYRLNEGCRDLYF
ncbi:MAG: [FeFe] hydrogenase H-cluster radical SAM maturase HydG [Clostridia bacterium]|nr:[FeFe] hydrogenase H-cluster radical SAM maturase HydG [Clostridia bacterium]